MLQTINKGITATLLQRTAVLPSGRGPTALSPWKIRPCHAAFLHNSLTTYYCYYYSATYDWLLMRQELPSRVHQTSSYWIQTRTNCRTILRARWTTINTGSPTYGRQHGHHGSGWSRTDSM